MEAPAKKAKRISEITKMKKKKADCRRAKTRVNLGKAFSRWRDIRAETGSDTDGALAMFLLDFYEKVAASSTSAEKLPYAVPERFFSCDEAFIKEEMDTECASTFTSETKKCSVDGCVSWRRRALCFNLPEDPQLRLQWVQFVTEANGQFSNLSCTGITVCKEHFLEEYFESHNETDGLKLKPSAVPTIVIKSEVDKLSLHQEEPVESENSGQHGEIVPRSTMNTKRCPLHGYTFQIPNGAGTLPQLCLQYINISNKQHQPGSIEVTLEPEQTEDHVHDSEALEEGDISDEEEDGNDGDASSDEDWVPETLTTAEVRKMFSKEDSEEEELCEDEISSNGRKMKQLCTECGAFYYSVNHICEHNKPHVCNVCSKRFVTKISLKLHSSIHSASREHPCKYCYATFKTKLDKLAHHRTHWNQTKPYKCPDCTETFASNEKRRTHLKKHGGPNGKKCDICGITFWQKHSLARHMVTHTGAKPYKCSVCKRTFNQAGHLKSHMRLHTGEKPYKCQRCDESFNHNVSLKSHIQRHHSLDLRDKMGKRDDWSDAHEHSETRADCVDSVQKEQNIEQVQQERVVKSSYKRRNTGRPVGRPKRNETRKRKSSKTKSPKENSIHDSNVESEENFTDSDFFDTQKEEIEQTVRKGTPKCTTGSDSDPNKERKKSRGQRLGNCRGRTRKT